jgi:3-dehydroquinate synthase
MNIRSYRRTYDVSFASLSETIDEIRGLKNKYAIIDKNVYDLHGDVLEGLFKDNIYLLDATENNKTLDVSKEIIEKIVMLDSRKETNIVVIGGGITQDVSCFAASVLYRGVDWYFVPTTLLAQADSCIGSKSSINMIPYKNLLGTFYPPKKIFICTEFVTTLPDKEYKSGLGEIAKCALLGGKKEFDEFAGDIDAMLAGDHEKLQQGIKRTLTYKKGLIEIDEFDMGVRNILNYGHTFGHAIESASGYGIPHGQAVSIGMLIANSVSLRRESITDDRNSFIFGVIVKMLSKELITKEIFDPAVMIPRMKKDKKYQGNHNCILLDKEGANKYPVAEAEIISALSEVQNSLGIYLNTKTTPSQK